MNRDRTDIIEWIQRRTEAVRSKYSAFDALIEMKVDNLSDEETPVSVFCPFHPNTKTAAARYYPGTGRKPGKLHCFTCQENWDSINLYAKFKGLRFMDALSDLERRFRIKIPKRPEGPAIVEPTDRDHTYVSVERSDIPKVLSIVETKLLRIRDKVCMTDYVKFCRVLDAIIYDYEKIGKPTPAMVDMLSTIDVRMSEAVHLASFVPEIDNDPGTDTAV